MFQASDTAKRNYTDNLTGSLTATAGTILWGPSNVFVGLLWETNFEFFFSKLVYFIFLNNGWAPKRCGPGVAYPRAVERVG